MGGKWSITAKDLNDVAWKVGEFNLPFVLWVIKSIYCLCRYDVVVIGKHGGCE